MKLMIVDDSMAIRNKIARENALEGITKILSAKNGKEAVEMFRDALPDIVTMDLTMPEMDGVECIKELIKLKPDVVILVISALADKATAIQAMHNGARGFLCKPFSQNQLSDALNKLIVSIKQPPRKS
ncbi:MAG TPA: response regulator [Pseudomonadales bacterium]|nr:response regulator [Pseudomonadales bacterium]